MFKKILKLFSSKPKAHPPPLDTDKINDNLLDRLNLSSNDELGVVSDYHTNQIYIKSGETYSIKLNHYYRSEGDLVFEREKVIDIDLDINIETLNNFTRKKSIVVFSRKTGVLEILKNEGDVITKGEPVFIIRHIENLDEKIKERYSFEVKKICNEQKGDSLTLISYKTPSNRTVSYAIELDEFTGSRKVIMKALNDSSCSKISTRSKRNSVTFDFGFESKDDKNFISFRCYQKHFRMREDDIIQFLFYDNTILTFNPFTPGHQTDRKSNGVIIESKSIIKEEEISIFCKQRFKSWKLTSAKTNAEAIGGEGVSLEKFHLEEDIILMAKAFNKIKQPA